MVYSRATTSAMALRPPLVDFSFLVDDIVLQFSVSIPSKSYECFSQSAPGRTGGFLCEWRRKSNVAWLTQILDVNLSGNPIGLGTIDSGTCAKILSDYIPPPDAALLHLWTCTCSLPLQSFSSGLSAVFTGRRTRTLIQWQKNWIPYISPTPAPT